jgi:hypothetical protein
LVGSDQRTGRRVVPGGIISLAKFTEEHRGAIAFDLLTKTNYSIDDVGGELSWFALSSFIRNLNTDSALARELGKSTGWEDTLTTNRILADIYDLLQVINGNLVAIGGGKHKKITPYPRPKGKDDEKKHIGKGAIPFDELKEWFKEKRKNGKR